MTSTDTTTTNVSATTGNFTVLKIGEDDVSTLLSEKQSVITNNSFAISHVNNLQAKLNYKATNSDITG